MSPSLSSMVPNADDLLALEVEEVAGVLLAHLNSYSDDSGNNVVQRGQISRHNFFNNLNHHPEYPGRQAEVNQVLMEAWSWLQGRASWCGTRINPPTGSLFRDVPND